MMQDACTGGTSPEIALAKIVNFDSLRAYRQLVTIAAPSQKLYGYLRNNGVDLNHVINLLEGAITLCEWRINGGPKRGLYFSPRHGGGRCHSGRCRAVLDARPDPVRDHARACRDSWPRRGLQS